MIRMWQSALVCAALAAFSTSAPASPHAAPAPADPECAANGSLTPYCGLPFPEDLETLPGGAGVIASEMRVEVGPNGLAGRPGTLKALDFRTRQVTPLYPAPTASQGRPDWGDPSCPGEIGGALLPHGIQLSRRKDGRWQLLVVNHGGRESVEFFELTGKPGHWSLGWRGCVVPPAPSHLNDVAALPGGGFVVTTMHVLGNAETRNAEHRAQQGENTGFLWRWMPGGPVQRQPGSDTPMPNGVQVDSSGRYAYINTASKGGDVRKLDLAAGVVVGTVAVPNPDNSSWTRNGMLLVAGVAPGPKPMACFMHPGSPCPVASDVFLVNPATMQARRIFEHAGLPLNAATVAVQSGDDILIGSCFGQSVVRAVGVLRAQPSQRPARR